MTEFEFGVDSSTLITSMVNQINETVKQLEEKRIAKALEENDFFVGSHKALFELKQAFPDMKVYYSQGIDENKIFVIAHAELYPFEQKGGEE